MESTVAFLTQSSEVFHSVLSAIPFVLYMM